MLKAVSTKSKSFPFNVREDQMKLLYYISILVLSFLVIFPFAFAQQNETMNLDEPQIFGNVNLNSFNTEGHTIGDINFTLILEKNYDFGLFLSSAKGEYYVTIENANITSTEDFNRYSYELTNFKGQFNTQDAQNYPLDSYELIFLLGISAEEFIPSEQIFFSSSFVDRSLYTLWNLETELLSGEEYSRYSNYLAISDDEFKNEIIKKDLQTFYAMKVVVNRPFWVLPKSFLLVIPPVLVLGVLIFSFFLIENKKAQSNSNFSNLIKLYAGLAFFLSSFLIALRDYIPSSFTWLEGLLIFELILSFEFLAFVIVREKNYFGQNKNLFFFLFFVLPLLSVVVILVSLLLRLVIILTFFFPIIFILGIILTLLIIVKILLDRRKKQISNKNHKKEKK